MAAVGIFGPSPEILTTFFKISRALDAMSLESNAMEASGVGGAGSADFASRHGSRRGIFNENVLSILGISVGVGISPAA